MIHSSQRNPRIKAIAEVLAMMSDEWLWESATEFCAALDLYAGRALQRKEGIIDPFHT
jgi:hypothetical protein